jgi:Retrotransposon gag protein.
MSSIKIELAERLLTTFDGDKSKLYEFCDNCDKAISLVDANVRPVLFAIISTKITGNARALIRNREFIDWLSLKAHLLDAYSEKRSHGQWQLELSSCRQNINESVMSYATRIENCLIKLTNSLDSTLSTLERAACVKLLKLQALNVFIMGLHKDISILVKAQKPEGLEDAIQYAIAEENEQKSKLEIIKYQNVNEKPFRHCSICNRPGHTTSVCFRNTSNNLSRPSSIHVKTEPNVRHFRTNNGTNQFGTNNQQQYKQPNNLVKLCNYCKNVGHTINECRKREYNNNRNRYVNQQQRSEKPAYFNTTEHNSQYVKDRNPPELSVVRAPQSLSKQTQHLNYHHAPVTAEPRSICNIQAENQSRTG